MKKYLLVLFVVLFSSTFVFSQSPSNRVVCDIFPGLFYLKDFQINKLLEQNGFPKIKKGIEGIGLGYYIPVNNNFLMLIRMDLFSTFSQKNGDKQTDFRSLFLNTSLGYYLSKNNVWSVLLTAGPSFLENYLTIMEKGSIDMANVEQSSAKQYNLYLGAPMISLAVNNEFFPSKWYQFDIIIGYNMSLSKAQWMAKNAFISGISNTENLNSFYFSISKTF